MTTENEVVLITGGARGQGRSHAVAFAERGANIVICDLTEEIPSVPYGLGTLDDLEQTRKTVEATGARCLALTADVRKPAEMEEVVARAVASFGRIDIACANAGILSFGAVQDLPVQTWTDMIDVNLTGVFNTVRAVTPRMIDQQYGRIIATASMAGRGGFSNISHYVAAKWGVIGFIKSVAVEVARHGVTANVVAPTNVDSLMIQNEAIWALFAGPDRSPTREAAEEACSSMTALGIPWVQPCDVTRAVLFLADRDCSMITGEVIHVAAGANAYNSA